MIFFLPISFLLYAKGLSALIKKAIADGSMVCRNGHCLSHLFFLWMIALFFAKNRAKTLLYFSSNTAKEVREEIKARFEA